MTRQFAEKMTRSQQRRQEHLSGERSTNCLVSELVGCQRGDLSSKRPRSCQKTGT